MRCNDVPHYNSELLEDATLVDVQLTYNIQEFWGLKRIYYSPRPAIVDLTDHVFS